MTELIPSRVTCERATALLVDYVAGELDPATTQLLEAHLARCRDCVAFLRTYGATIRMSRTVCYEELPVELQDRLLQSLQAKMTDAPSS